MSDLSQQLSLLLEKHRNHYLFSDYYLDHLLPRRLDWQEATAEARAAMKRLQTIYAAFTPTENEAQTERDWIRPVLEALSHVFEVQPSIATPDGVRRPDYVFFPTDNARQAAKPLQGREDYPATALAVGDAKHWDRSLDQTLKGDGRKPRDPFTNKNPSWQIYFYMLHAGRAWGILTNGRCWRLYHKDTAHKLNYYYEVDLPALLGNGDVEAFKYFYLFFRQASFIPNGEGRTWLDIILRESRDYAEGVSEDLKEQVYEALRHVAQGFLDCTGNNLTPDRDVLEAIYDNSLILLYRLLFILYAESRGLLPLQDNEAYRLTYSLDAIKKYVERDLIKPILPSSRRYWVWLQELLGSINGGNEHLGVPAYNGDLFATEKHPFLEQYAVGDHGLRQAIDLLARIDTEEGRVFVDYRDLEVRHLGSIYEGLLEYQLRYAEEDLAVVKEKGRERYVPAGEGQEVAVPAGRVYLVTDRGERKATGSYYTPDYIVKYIVEQTLGPLLDETFARWADRKNVTEEDLVNDILSLDVLDPAMGSGHFLVEATEYIARYVVGLGLEATAGMGAEAELDYWKRRVVQSCIYGVDLNPLAVELAKLSLWLATVSRDKPLSFLDHHLRCGNSLIGARVADLGTAPVVKKRRKAEEEEAAGQLSMFEDDAFRQSMMTAVDSMWLIEGMDSSTVEGVKEQERIYRELRDQLTRRYRRLADLKTACCFGVEIDSAMWPGLVTYATGRAPAQVPQYEAMLKQAGTIAEDRHFFHWELEFPEVFFDHFGRPLKDQAGFDAVMGNPPYFSGIKVSDEDLGYLSEKYGDLWAARNDISYYFYVDFVRYLREGGLIGLIFPRYYLDSHYAVAFRDFMAETTKLAELVDTGNYQVFEGVNILTTILVVQAGSAPPGHTFDYRVCSLDNGGLHVEKLYQIRQERLRRRKWQINMLVQEELFDKLKQRTVRLGELVEIGKGMSTGFNEAFELDAHVAEQTFSDKRFLRDLIKNGDIRKYFVEDTGRKVIYPEKIERIEDSPEYVEYLGDFEAQLHKRRNYEGPWYKYSTPRNKDLWERLGAKIVVPFMATENRFAIESRPIISTSGDVNVLFPKDESQYSMFSLLALLNSQVLEFYHANTTKLKRGGYMEYVTMQLAKLPIRHIAFTTLREERESLREIGITEATEWIEGAEGPSVSSVSFSAFSGSNLGRWLDARLTADPEQSDVVHDLLAHLAGQMIEMNKEKQAETRGFLDWLADYTGLPIEDWTLKTSLKAYYEQDWEEMRRVLDRNGRKITKVNVEGREASDLIRNEWEASVGKVRPLLARIAVTDRLIDLIVYRLYGLTEEEIAVVEQ